LYITEKRKNEKDKKKKSDLLCSLSTRTLTRKHRQEYDFGECVPGLHNLWQGGRGKVGRKKRWGKIAGLVCFAVV
jgi:hypothetical protein